MDKYKYLKKGNVVTLNPYNNELYTVVEIHDEFITAIPKEGGQEVVLRGEIYKIEPVKQNYNLNS